MKEIKSVIKAYDSVPKDLGIALATVVRVEGSSYRRTGARMLVCEDGNWTGGISGGCLEGDALKRARLAINNALPTLITYDTTDDDPHQIGVGLGCNGVIDVLFTPLNRNNRNNPVEVLKQCLEDSRQNHVLLTITSVSPQNHYHAGDVIRYSPRIKIPGFDQQTQEKLKEEVGKIISANHSAPCTLETDTTRINLFVEIIPPEIHVVLMGHQYDVHPTARLVKELGWRVTVCGNLSKLNSMIRSYADELISIENFEHLHCDAYTAVVLMAHDYNTDKKNLVRALDSGAGFIGMLGPRSRAEKIWAELENSGRPISGDETARIHAPVGLDIGAVAPEEIALSLAAGIRAAFSGRDGTFLRNRQAPIHPRR